MKRNKLKKNDYLVNFIPSLDNDAMKKYAIAYIRVSSEEQITNFSLENQKEYCVKEAHRQGFEIVEIFREEGVSAKDLNRPQMIRLFEYCRKYKGKISTLFIYKIDRISRNTLDFLSLKKRLAGYGIRVIPVTEQTEDNPAGEFIETMLAANATMDNATKSIRTLDGMKKRVESGYALGRPRVGYIVSNIEGDKAHNPDPEQFHLVKKAWIEMSTGTYTLESIIPVMQKLGIVIKIGNRRIPITRNQQTQRIFRDKYYAGYVVSNKFKINKIGNHSPMISEELYYKVQGIIDRRSYSAGVSHNKQNEDFPLRGVLCGECGKPMTGSWSRGRKNRYAYYYCGQGRHKAPSIPKDQFESEFVDCLLQIQPKKEFISLFSAMLKEKWESRYQYLKDLKKAAERELDALYEARRRLVEKNLSGLYSDEIFQEQLTLIEDQILVKKISKSETELDEIDIDTIVNFMNNFLANIHKAWIDGNLYQKRVLFGSIFPKNITYTKEGYRTTEIGLPFRLISELEDTSTSSWVNCWTNFVPPSYSILASIQYPPTPQLYNT